MIEFKGKQIYFGDLHCHTGFSDGKLTPAEAFKQAAAEKELDFMAVTDHAASITQEKFEKTIKAAKECTTDSFVAIAGCEDGIEDSYENEYGIPVINGGEIVVLNSNTWSADSRSLEELTEKLENNKEAIGGFAHPQEASWPTEKLWNGYDMIHHRSQQVKEFIRMIEVCNETSDYNLIHEKLYPTALDCGFHVSAVAVSDTHNNNWGSRKLRSRTAVFLNKLSQKEILQALRIQKCYAAESGNTAFQFTINGREMGEELEETEDYHFEIDIQEFDEKEEYQIHMVEIISDYGNCLYRETCKTHQIHIDITLKSNTARYFYIRSINGAGERLWSSPIWTGRKFDEIEQLPVIQKLDKSKFQITSLDSPQTVCNLCNNNPDLPWRCSLGSSAIIDLGDVYEICAVGYHRHTIPYGDTKEVKSLLNRYAYYLSMDGNSYHIAAEGIMKNYGSEQIHYFPAEQARYVKIEAISCVGSDAGFSDSVPAIGEITIYTPAKEF